MQDKILILGSNGILGKYIIEKVIHSFGVENLVISDYEKNRLSRKMEQICGQFGKEPNSRVIDVNSEDSVRKGLNSIGIVILAIQQNEPLIQRLCLEYNIPSIDVSVNPKFISKALSLNKQTTNQSLQLITAGLFPGLSGILAKEIAKRSAKQETVDVGLLQSANGTNGKTGVSDMLTIFDRDVEWIQQDNSAIKSGFSHKKKFRFPDPIGNATLRLADFVERNYLKSIGINSNYWTSFDKESLNKSISLLKKLGFLRLFKYPVVGNFLSAAISKQNQGDKQEVIGLVAKSSNSEIYMVLKSDYEATASCVIAFAKKMLGNKRSYNGVRFPFEAFIFEEIKSDVSDVIMEISALDKVRG
jgi:saccharopine dehydrogenase-like NADP-dependent oxidoreductase